MDKIITFCAAEKTSQFRQVGCLLKNLSRKLDKTKAFEFAAVLLMSDENRLDYCFLADQIQDSMHFYSASKIKNKLSQLSMLIMHPSDKSLYKCFEKYRDLYKKDDTSVYHYLLIDFRNPPRSMLGNEPDEFESFLKIHHNEKYYSLQKCIRKKNNDTDDKSDVCIEINDGMYPFNQAIYEIAKVINEHTTY